MQGLRPLFLLRCRLAPKQASANRHRRRNSLTLKTGWRSLWYLEVAGHGPCGRPHPMYVIIFIVGRWQGAE